MDMLLQLEEHCSIRADRWVDEAYRLTFSLGQVVTTIRVIFKGTSSVADMTITNMTTLPEDHIREGHGSNALQTLLICASESGLVDIRAVQVQKGKGEEKSENELFWIKNGFISLGNQTNDFQYHGEL